MKDPLFAAKKFQQTEPELNWFSVIYRGLRGVTTSLIRSSVGLIGCNRPLNHSWVELWSPQIVGNGFKTVQLVFEWVKRKIHVLMWILRSNAVFGSSDAAVWKLRWHLVESCVWQFGSCVWQRIEAALVVFGGCVWQRMKAALTAFGDCVCGRTWAALAAGS